MSSFFCSFYRKQAALTVDVFLFAALLGACLLSIFAAKSQGLASGFNPLVWDIVLGTEVRSVLKGLQVQVSESGLLCRGPSSVRTLP